MQNPEASSVSTMTYCLSPWAIVPFIVPAKDKLLLHESTIRELYKDSYANLCTFFLALGLNRPHQFIDLLDIFGMLAVGQPRQLLPGFALIMEVKIGSAQVILRKVVGGKYWRAEVVNTPII